MNEAVPELQLPGFRFHPTEEELLGFYLKNIVYGKKVRFDIIGLLNIYHHDPWDLPGLAKIGEREWYFFVPRDRKHANGGRPNRTTVNGFWKATGSDRRVFGLTDPKRVMGLKKTLVFYTGRAPKGAKTDWVMNEYRLPDTSSIPKDIVICKIYRKATSLKVLEQRAAMEQEMKSSSPASSYTSPMSSMKTVSFSNNQQESHEIFFKNEEQHDVAVEADLEKILTKGGGTLNLPSGGKEMLFELQVPKMSMDWSQDSLWSLLNSPWFQNLTPPAC